MTTNEFFLVLGLGGLGGIAIGLVVARLIPQKMNIVIGVMPVGQMPDDPDSDPAEAWKGKS